MEKVMPRMQWFSPKGRSRMATPTCAHPSDLYHGKGKHGRSLLVHLTLFLPTAGRGQDEIPTMTNASWRLIKWAREYAGLMRVLRSDCGTVYSGLCELFEMYFLHAYYVFSDVPIPEMVAQKQVKVRQGGL
jgi:hypothetical protein